MDPKRVQDLRFAPPSRGGSEVAGAGRRGGRRVGALARAAGGREVDRAGRREAAGPPGPRRQRVAIASTSSRTAAADCRS